MKKYFITGLILLLPLALTIVIVGFFFNLLTAPFIGIVQSILEQFNLFHKGFLFLSQKQFINVSAKILILAFLFFFTVLIGIFTRWVFIHYLFRIGDYIIHRIPFINTIYIASQEVIKTIFTSKTKSFKQAVLIPFPNPKTYSVGFITKENVKGLTTNNTSKIAVFVPTTPNPTSGFLMMFDPKDIIYLDISVETALKYIISCGVISTTFKVKKQEK